MRMWTSWQAPTDLSWILSRTAQACPASTSHCNMLDATTVGRRRHDIHVHTRRVSPHPCWICAGRRDGQGDVKEWRKAARFDLLQQLDRGNKTSSLFMGGATKRCSPCIHPQRAHRVHGATVGACPTAPMLRVGLCSSRSNPSNFEICLFFKGRDGREDTPPVSTRSP